LKDAGCQSRLVDNTIHPGDVSVSAAVLNTDYSHDNAHIDDSTLAWIIGLPPTTATSRPVGELRRVVIVVIEPSGGVYYHGAYATGRPLHVEKWTDLGGGAGDASHFSVASCGVVTSSLAKDATNGVTHASYTVADSATAVVNGTYHRTEHLQSGAPCFENGNGILLFQSRLRGASELSSKVEWTASRLEQKTVLESL
jgi:hypothetical protein